MKKYISLMLIAALAISSTTIGFASENDPDVTADSAVVTDADVTAEDFEVMAAVDAFTIEEDESAATATTRKFSVKYNSGLFDAGITNFKVNIKSSSTNVTNIVAEATAGIDMTQSYDDFEGVLTCSGSNATKVVAPNAVLFTFVVTLGKPINTSTTITLSMTGDTMISDDAISYSLASEQMNAASVSFSGKTDSVNSLPNGNSGVSGGFTWNFDGAETLTLRGHGNMATYSETNPAPWSNDNGLIKHVVFIEDTADAHSISDYAFAGLSNLIDVIMPSHLGSIGNSAFENCESLQSVNIDLTSLTGIGANAFKGCTSLSEIKVPNTVTSIGASAFEGCTSLNTITVPFVGPSRADTTNTFSFIFGGNVPSSVKRVMISDAVRIQDNAFKDCSSIQTIRINDVTEGIGVSAFENCSSLQSFTVPSTVKEIKKNTFKGCSNATEIIIHDAISVIGESAFENCSKFTKINDTNTIPSGVTTLNNATFKNCSSLVELVIPATVKNIGTELLMGCTSLHVLTVPFIGSTDNVGDTENSQSNQIFGYFFGGANSSVPAEVTKVTVINPGQYSAIPPYAFAGCANVVDIDVQGGANVYKNAFENCKNLKNLYLPRSVQYIGSTILAGCTGIETLKVPFVGTNRRDANSETSVIGGFFGWTDGSPKPTDIQQIYNDNGDSHYYHIPASLKNVIVLAQTTVPRGAFADMRSLEKVAFISGATLSNQAFYDCQTLKEVKLPDDMTIIGEEAFAECYSLTKINIPGLVQSIGRNAFYNAECLTEITIPDSVKIIDSTTFIGAGVKKDYSTYELGTLANEFLTIKCSANSYAAKFAAEKGINTMSVSQAELDMETPLVICDKQSDGSYMINVNCSAEGTVYAALYGNNGELLAVRTVQKTSADEGNVQLSFTADESANAVTAKAFVWDGMKNLTEVQEDSLS